MRNPQFSSSLPRTLLFLLTAVFAFAPTLPAQKADFDLVGAATSQTGAAIDSLFGTKSNLLATKTWDGGGATSNWSEAANWSDDTVPAASDDVVFDATSTKNATIDGNFIIRNLNVNAGYAGTITQANGTTLTVANARTSGQAGGNFVCGAGAVVVFDNVAFTLANGSFDCRSGSVNGRFFDLVLNGGVFRAPTGVMHLGDGAFGGENSSIALGTNGTFDPGGGTLVAVSNFFILRFSGSSQRTLEVNNFTFDSPHAGAALSSDVADGRLRVAGTLNLTRGNHQTTVEAHGAVNIASTYGNTNGAGVLLLAGAATRTVTLPTLNDPNRLFSPIESSAPNTTLATNGAGPIKLRSINISAGTFNTGAVPVSLGNGISFIDSFLSGTGAINCGVGGVFNFEAVNFRQSGGNFNCQNGTINGSLLNLFVNGGTFNAPAGVMSFSGENGALIRGANGVFNHHNGTVSFDSRHQSVNIVEGGAGTQEFFNLNVNNEGNSNIADNLDTLRVIGTLRLRRGQFNGGTLEARGDIFVGSQFSLQNPVKFIVSGANDQTYTNEGGGNPRGFWTIDKSGGTLTLASDLDISVMEAGQEQLNLVNGTITTGNFVVNAGRRDVVRTNGYIVGKLRREIFSTGGNRLFPVGTANGYSPVSASVAILTQNPSGLTVGVTGSPHPQLNPATALRRYWTTFETGDLTAALTFNYLPADVAGNEANYKANRITSGNVEILGAVNAAADAFSVGGVTNFDADWTASATAAPLSIAPTQRGANPGEQIPFTATGGNAPYAFSLFANNSGASINPTTGVYTAGSAVGATDTVRVTDADGNAAQATVNILDSFTVVNTNASGAGSLARAIENANFAPGVQTVRFNIPGAAPFTVRPTNRFYVSDAVVIDGSTQPGFNGKPVVELDGSDMTGSSDAGLVLGLGSDGSVVKNLAINRYSEEGIDIVSSNNRIEGCFIGTNTDGTVALGNEAGIRVGAPGNTIGGTNAAARNVISGNTTRGINISAENTIVQGNYIGTAADGVTPLGNAAGILLGTAARDNVIGGTSAGEANVIAFNDSQTSAAFGLRVNHSGGNSIRGNSIHSNANLGIDLGAQGVTPNDACDADTGGGNDLQNFPVISSAGIAGSAVLVQGTLDSQPNRTYTLDFYASPQADPSGNGEGRIYLGSGTAQTDAGCRATFSVSLNAALSGSEVITATATGADNSTSEFSAAHPLGAIDPFEVINTNDSGTGSLRQAITNANNTPGTQTITFDIPGAAPYTITPQTILPTITEAVVLDATTQPGFNGSPVVVIRGEANAVLTGLIVNGSGSTIKGFAFVNFSGRPGMVLGGSANTVQGNFFGINPDGTGGAPNFGGITVTGSNNLIGGFAPGERNVISGNAGTGATLQSGGNTVRGNYIGTDPTGTAAIPNGEGIAVRSNQNVIEGNVISGNTGNGIVLSSQPNFSVKARDNTITGNLIGLNANAAAVLGNGADGIRIINSAEHLGNRVSANRIFGNGGIAVRFANGRAANAPLPNDPQDPDAGANNLQNHPLLRFPFSVGSQTILRADLNSTPSSNFTVEFFSSPSCDALTGDGEGETFLGSTNVMTDAGGIAVANIALPAQVPNGRFITATATDAAGNASEFSPCKPVTAIHQISGRLTDNNGLPLRSAIVRQIVVDGSGTRNFFVLTNNSGIYRSLFQPAGSTITIAPDVPGLNFAPPSRSYPNIGADHTEQNFTGTPQNFTVRGNVASRFGGTTAPIGGRRIDLSGGRTTFTDANGNYVFSNVPVGNYTLSAVPQNGYSFTPASYNFALAADRTFDFTAQLDPPVTGRIAYSGADGLYVMNADGGAAVKIASRAVSGAANGLPLSSPAISPDGSKIAFTKYVLFPQSNGTVYSVKRVFVMNFDGTNQHRVTPLGTFAVSEDGPTWSPDGTKLAFVRRTGEIREIRIINLNAAAETPVRSAGIDLRALSWSPDGTKIAYQASLTSNSSQIQVSNSDGSGTATVLAALAGSPSWSPDGSKIAFILHNANTSLTGRIALINPDGSGISLLTDSSSGFFNSVDWSPDGDYLVFRRSAPNIGMIKADGSRILDFPASADSPNWGVAFAPPTLPGSPVNVVSGATSVTFGDVAGAGETTVIPIPPHSAGEVPNGFVVGQFGAYEISTTASVAPPITVCFIVPPVPPTVFNQITILHRENGVLVPKPTVRNFSALQVCAQVSSLSPFVLAEQIDPALPSISGLAIDAAGNALSNVEIKLTGAENRTTVTGSDGFFSFPNLTTGANYNVQPKQLGYLFTEYSRDFVGLTGENTIVFTGAASQYQISGRVVDGGGTSVAGVTVALDGSATAQTVTDADGNYAFTNLPADGSYLLSASNGASAFVPAQIFVSALTDDAAVEDFVMLAPTAAGVSIGGRVVDARGNAIMRARLRLSLPDGQTRTALTNSFGYYNFSNLPAGATFVVTISHARYRFDQPTRVVSPADSVTDLDFAAGETDSGER